MSILNREGLDVVSHFDHPFSVYMEEDDKVYGGLIITTKNLKKASRPRANNSGKYSFLVHLEFEKI